jgi:hypothetical protein
VLAFMLVIPFLAIIRVWLGDMTETIGDLIEMFAFVVMTYGLWCFLRGMNGGLLARVPPDTPAFCENAPWSIQN